MGCAVVKGRVRTGHAAYGPVSFSNILGRVRSEHWTHHEPKRTDTAEAFMTRAAYLLIAVSSVASLALVSSACGSSATSSEGDPAPAATNAPPAPPASTGATSGGTPPPPPVTPVPKAVRFVAMGDVGDGSAGQLKIAGTVEAKCKQDGCDFVQLLGDNLYESGASSVDDPIWQANFEVPYAAINLDFYAVLGNHDYGNGGQGTDFLKGQNEVDYTKKSKKWKMPSAYFHFEKENAQFIALDTNMALFGQAGTQKTDVTAWLAASKSEWKIALGHHPYKSNGPHGNAGNYDGIPLSPISGKNVQTFLEEVVCGKVDVYLCGHDHSRQWLNVSCKGTELAVSGAGAKATELKANNAALFESLEIGFLYVVIEGKKLTAEFVDENGKTDFTHVLTKP